VTDAIDDTHAATYAGSDMATKKKAAKTTFRAMVAIRVLQEDADRLDELAERLPFVSRHALARAALKIGLAALEADPTRIVKEEMVKPSTGRRRPSTRQGKG
jgi:predicted transcriptional regulator